MNSSNCTTDAFLQFLLLLLIVNEKESEKKILQYIIIINPFLASRDFVICW